MRCELRHRSSMLPRRVRHCPARRMSRIHLLMGCLWGLSGRMYRQQCTRLDKEPAKLLTGQLRALRYRTSRCMRLCMLCMHPAWECDHVHPKYALLAHHSTTKHFCRLSGALEARIQTPAAVNSRPFTYLVHECLHCVPSCKLLMFIVCVPLSCCQQEHVLQLVKDGNNVFYSGNAGTGGHI